MPYKTPYAPTNRRANQVTNLVATDLMGYECPKNDTSSNADIAIII